LASSLPGIRQSLPRLIADSCIPVAHIEDRLDSLHSWIGHARIVLIGEATHGTHEFYQIRAQITRRLIEENGFSAVLVEADWPDAYRVNRFVRGVGPDEEAVEALADFERFPTWMWRNSVVLDFVGWLREHNQSLSPGQHCGFYGMDLYSLYASMRAVVRFLEGFDPKAAEEARRRYACFDHFGGDPQAYAYAAVLAPELSCRDQVISQLVELRARTFESLPLDGSMIKEDMFAARQNAQLARNAEEYYRTMLEGRVSSWNLRDRHMVQTLDALVEHLSHPGLPAKVVVWAHNSHLGDARSTEMGERGELNVGQLVHERYAGQAYSIGFTTYEGTVSAASAWDGPVARKRVKPALAGSIEKEFHLSGESRFLLNLKEESDLTNELKKPRLERAIGVIYLPETERVSHYFNARLSEQFHAVIHWDMTRAVEPLERGARWHTDEIPETFPTGL
jgi:erythromycin esterase-like protein